MVQTRLNNDLKLIWGLMGIPLIIFAGFVFLLWGSPSACRITNDRSAGTSLKTIVSAQIEFRTQDPCKSGVRQFWRKDVVGLYTLRPRNEPTEPAIKLIELSVACADDRSGKEIEEYSVKAPKAGYWFRAIRHADEKQLSPERFAVVAIPASYPTSGKHTLVVDERNIIYRADLGHGNGIDVFPTDEELKAKWTKLD